MPGSSGAAVRDPFKGVDQRGDVDDAIFQQVAESGRVRLRQGQGVATLHRLRQQQNPQRRPVLPQPRRRLGTLVGEGRRHTDIDDGDIGQALGHGHFERRAVADAGDDLDTGLGQQPGQGLAQQARIVGDHDAHGNSAVIIVP